MTTSVQRTVELDIGGMTCASCAARVEKKLNRLDGVQATVNYATEQARVSFPSAVEVADLIGTVEKTGYTATKSEPLFPGPADSAATATGYETARDDQGFGQSNVDAADGPHDAELATLRGRLVGSAILTIPVMVLSMVPPWQFTYWQWLCLAMAAPVATWGAWPFHRAAGVNARHGAATMDTLISLGVSAAFVWSLYALFIGGAGEPGMRMSFEWLAKPGQTPHVYLEAAAGVTLFLLAGRYFEARAKTRSGEALRSLAQIGAKDVTVERGGATVTIPVGQLAVDDVFLARPGEKIATDGTVLDGSSAIDASMITGESVPVEVGAGDAIVGGTVNVGGRLRVVATRVGADTQLAHMAQLVRDAQSGKAPVQRLADRISAIFVPIVIALAVATLVVSLLVGVGVQPAFTAAVAVLIIACPCALGLATPTALLVGTGRGAQLGVLIRGPEILESTRKIDTILLDKTGTVTTGTMSVREVLLPDEYDDPAAERTARLAALRIAAAVEQASEHPIGAAITAAARAECGDLPAVTEFAATAGLGVSGVVEGQRVMVGRPAMLSDAGYDIDPSLRKKETATEKSGATVVALGVDGSVHALLAIADTVKPSSRQAIKALKDLGLRPLLLTGDNRSVATTVAADVGIDRDDVIAQVLPEGKVAAVRRLQQRGAVVAMVGDGVNDAPALAAADLGLSMGTGTDVAMAASDLTLVRGDLLAAGDAIRLSRRTLGTIKGNLFWAFAYNTAALPLAALGLANPLLAGAAMAFSSVFVVTNSLRLRSFR